MTHQISKSSPPKRLLRYLICATALTAGAGSIAWGDTLTQFSLNGNNALCGCSENVTATFTAMANGDLQVVLSNLADSSLDRQILTGIQFQFGGSGSSAGSVSSQAPNGNSLYNINDATGALTAATGTLTAWHTQLDLSPYVTLTNLGGTGAKGGAQGIIGSATTGAVNNLSNHNPYVLGSATIVIHGLTGITGSTAISGVNFNFGTALDNYVSGSSAVNTSLTATPEPGTLAMFSAGALLLGLSSLRRPSSKPK